MCKKTLAVYRQHQRLAFHISEMKSCLTILLAVLSINLFGQSFNNTNDEQQKHTEKKTFYLKTNPLAVLVGPIPLTAEYRIAVEAVANNRVSYQVSGSYLNKSLLFSLLQNDSANAPVGSDFKFPGYRLQGEARFYFVKFQQEKIKKENVVPSGFYSAINVSYSFAKLGRKAQAYPVLEFANFNINWLFGGQIIAGESIGADLFLGIGYKQNSLTNVDYRLRRTNLSLEENGFQGYYGSNLRVSLGMNLTFGLF
jgi:hypothetical protein